MQDDDDTAAAAAGDDDDSTATGAYDDPYGGTYDDTYSDTYVDPYDGAYDDGGAYYDPRTTATHRAHHRIFILFKAYNSYVQIRWFFLYLALHTIRNHSRLLFRRCRARASFPQQYTHGESRRVEET